MKAAVLYEAKKPLQVIDLEQGPPMPGEVVVRMGAAGICASDHHVMQGTAQLPMPVVLGHEGAGTVVATTAGVRNVAPGDRCILSFISNCGHCHTCRSGNPQLCLTNRATGARQFDGTLRLKDGEGNEIHQMSKIGVFAESLVAPAQACYPIPDDVPMDVAALIGCCVTTGVGAVINQPGLKPGATVAVFGVGGVGLNVVQGARVMNASRIIAVDILPGKLEFARRFGATDVINAMDVEPVAAIRELTGGGVDWAFDAFGGSVTISQAFDCLGPVGTAVMVGLAPVGQKAAIDMVDLVRNQKTLVGSYYGSASPHETFGTIIDLYRREQLDIAGLVTRHYALDQVNEAYHDLEQGKDGRGVIVF